MDWNNKEQVIKEVRKNGEALKYASDKLKNDPQILAVIEENIPSEIADGIEHTQTGMNRVVEETVTAKTVITDPNKGEKPGDEFGDN